jgi:hypothetical protein
MASNLLISGGLIACSNGGYPDYSNPIYNQLGWPELPGLLSHTQRRHTAIHTHRLVYISIYTYIIVCLVGILEIKYAWVLAMMDSDLWLCKFPAQPS